MGLESLAPTAVQTPDRQATCLGLDLLNRVAGRLRLKCDGTRTDTRFRLSAKRTSPFKSAGASVQSTTGSRSVRISGSNAGYTMFRGSVKGTGYLPHSPVSHSLPLPRITVCHHLSTGLYIKVDSVGMYISSYGGTTKNGYSKDFDSFFADFAVAITKQIITAATNFLRAFAKWRKVTISIVMSVRPSAGSHGTTWLPLHGFV